MSLIRCLILCVAVAWSAAVTFAQPIPQPPQGASFDRAYPATPNVSAFRTEGELRIWTFFSKKTAFGSLVSRVEPYDVAGQTALALVQELRIDYSKLGQEHVVVNAGRTILAENGQFLGSELTIGEGETAEQFEVRRTDGDRIEGFFTRVGQKVDVDISVPVQQPTWDQYFADQLEILLALRRLKVGDSIAEDVFSPQSLVSYRLRGQVKWFEWKQIYQERWDSVLYIQFTEPQRYEAFLTPNKRLVRLDLDDLDIRVYQDVVRPGGARTADSRSGRDVSRFTPRLVLFQLPHYVAYVVFGLLAAIFLSRGGLKEWLAYLALAAGAVVYAFMPWTQIPLQRLVVENFVAPRVMQGGSMFLWAVLPALTAAVIQELARLAAIFGVARWRGVPDGRLVLVGAFIGAGFGILEAIYLLGVSIQPLFDWLLLERLCGIVLHAALGAVIGCGLYHRGQRLAVLLPTAIVINTAIRYLPVFVQQKVIDLGLMHFVLAFLSLGVVVVTIVITRSLKPVRQAAGGGD